MTNIQHTLTCDLMCKVILVGDSGVGKSALITRFADDTFTASWLSTIGVDFKIRNLRVDGAVVKLSVWDTAGQDRFRSIIAAYYRGADVVLIAYDMTDERSFGNVSYWLKEVNKHLRARDPKAGPVLKVLVGTKTDLTQKDEETYEISQRIHKEAEKFAKENEMMFYETSSKTSANVEHLFYQIAYEMKNARGANSMIDRSSHMKTKKLLLNKEDTYGLEDENNNRGCLC